MSGITVNGTTFADLSEHQGIAGDYLANPPVGDYATMRNPEYNEIVFPFIGGTAAYTKRLCFLGRDIEFCAVHSGATIEAAYARRKNFVTAISVTNPSFSVAWLDGVTYTRCRLKAGGAVDLKIMSLNGKPSVVTKYSIRNLQE